MKRLLLAATLLMPVAALAADNAVIVTPGAGVIMRSRDTTGAGGPQSMITILGDTGGNPSGVFANYGTSPGAVLVPGMNAFVTNTPAVTQSGTWTVQPGNTPNTSPWLVAGNNSNASSALGTTSTNQASISWLYGFNGATWDQLQVDASKFLKVNCATGCSASTSITGWAGGTLGAMANYGTSPGAVLVPGVNAFITNTLGPGRAVSGSSSPVVPSSAPTTLHLIAANTNNATSQKGSPATLLACQFSNNSTTPGFFKVFNKASAPTMGTDIPVVTLIIPGPAAGGGGSNVVFGPGGLALSLGFAFAVTPLITDLDSTSVPAATFAINCQYD